VTPGPPARGVSGDAPRKRLEALLHAALEAVEGGAAVRRQLSRPADGGLVVGGNTVPPGLPVSLLAAGKASVPMARAFLEVAGPRVRRGLVVRKDGHGGDLPGLAGRAASHPVPDARSEAAGRAALALAESAREDEVLVVLLSGGASALLSCPAPGLRQADLAATTDRLLASGADIEAANAVRKHLSALAGGRLARAFRGREIHLLAISDVPGDRLDVIGSGPCSPDPSRFETAWQAVTRLGLEAQLPRAVCEHLAAGLRGERAETPAPGDPCFARVHGRVVARNADALAAAAEAAHRRGLGVTVDPQPLAGDAAAAGRAVLERAQAAGGDGPRVFLAGGETTVRFERAGRGGRSQELALAAALALEGRPGVALLAAGSDGTDGPTDAAGAFADGGSVARGAARGVSAGEALARHDSYTFWQAEGGLLRTGPTGTNVMDLVFVMLGGP